ncbi:MAG: Metal-dependent phosphohydrolase, subdomain:Hpt [Proteobacteria bacterium]|nr:Metal-dependent phosphohydrolase, subdomain:Hpt [Pseudomonadota bacterium]
MDVRALIASISQDRDALEEFADSLLDRAPQIERDVARLKKAPGDREVTADLFRGIHNIKGDAALCKFDLAVVLAHPIESIMSRFRDGDIEFSDLLAETILLAIDRLELATEALMQRRPIDNLRLEPLIEGMQRMALSAPKNIDSLARDLIEAVTGFIPVTGGPMHKLQRIIHSPEAKTSGAADLQFFRSLANQFENRSPLFRGRTMRILRLAMETNNVAGTPIDPLQLEAAVYMHDVGMMFLPESVWLKVGRMTDEEKALLHNHPAYAAGLLQRMTGWEDATEMVLQHQEMPDGRGYPDHLKGDAICDGAKILAIVDAFESVMLKHSHRGRNRSVLRAIAEINACDNQFAPEWITPFNTVIRRTIEA